MEVKLIIESDFDAKASLSMVSEVIDDGLISKGRHGEQYCFATVWPDGARCEASKTKNGTHTFRIWKR